jgi:hypothetical protein
MMNWQHVASIVCLRVHVSCVVGCRVFPAVAQSETGAKAAVLFFCWQPLVLPSSYGSIVQSGVHSIAVSECAGSRVASVRGGGCPRLWGMCDNMLIRRLGCSLYNIF